MRDVTRQPGPICAVLPKHFNREEANLGEGGIYTSTRVPLAEDETISFLPLRLLRTHPHHLPVENRQNIRQPKHAPYVRGPASVRHEERI